MNKRQIKNNRHKEKKNDDNSKAADKLYIPRKTADGNRGEPEEVCRKQQWKTSNCCGRRKNFRRWKDREKSSREEKNFMEKALHS